MKGNLQIRFCESLGGVIVWDKDKDKVEEKADSVLSAFRTMGQAEGVKESYGPRGGVLGEFYGVNEIISFLLM